VLWKTLDRLSYSGPFIFDLDSIIDGYFFLTSYEKHFPLHSHPLSTTNSINLFGSA